jgi:polyisoprenoid-binding protein YceI
MATHYRIASSQSRFTVQAFVTGLLSFLGHSPTFAVRDFAGIIDFAGDAIADLRLGVTIRADSLQVVDNVRPADRADIEGQMRRDVLEVATYPEITFQAATITADRVAQGHYRVRLRGPLALHGVTQNHSLDAEVLIFEDGLRLRGESSLRMSAYDIKPVTVFGGAIKLKGELHVSFDLVALPEGT